MAMIHAITDEVASAILYINECLHGKDSVVSNLLVLQRSDVMFTLTSSADSLALRSAFSCRWDTS